MRKKGKLIKVQLKFKHHRHLSSATQLGDMIAKCLSWPVLNMRALLHQAEYYSHNTRNACNVSHVVSTYSRLAEPLPSQELSASLLLSLHPLVLDHLSPSTTPLRPLASLAPQLQLHHLHPQNRPQDGCFRCPSPSLEFQGYLLLDPPW